MEFKLCLNSPDEMAHAAFIARFAESNSLTIPSAADFGPWAKFVFPRSTYSTGQEILPVGFWCLNVSYGLMAKVLGTGVVYFTSVLVLISAWCFRALIQSIFKDRQIADWSLVFYLAQPVVWYYTARSLFPNLPFFSLLMIGSYLLWLRPLSRRWLNDLLGGGLIGWALLIRPSEAIWVGLIFVWVLLLSQPRLSWSRLAWWMISLLPFLVGYLMVTRSLYSGIISYAATDSWALSHWWDWIFPFGIKPWAVIDNVFYYFICLFFWLSLPALIGVFSSWFAFNPEQRKKERGYVLFFLILAAFLFVFYGSYVDQRAFLRSIGISYTRYWLPLYVLIIPWTILGWRKMSHWWGSHQFQTTLWLGGLILMLILNAGIVFLGADGLNATLRNLKHGAEVRTDLATWAPAQTIVVTETEDKFFWPHFPVMKNVLDPDIGQAIRGLKESGWTMFFFTPLLHNGQVKILSARFAVFGLELVPRRIYYPHVLYEFRLLPDSGN